MKKDGLRAREKVRSALSVDSIVADVKRCRDLEDAEPCYHCRQKQFLLETIESLRAAARAVVDRIEANGVDFSRDGGQQEVNELTELLATLPKRATLRTDATQPIESTSSSSSSPIQD